MCCSQGWKSWGPVIQAPRDGERGQSVPGCILGTQIFLILQTWKPMGPRNANTQRPHGVGERADIRSSGLRLGSALASYVTRSRFLTLLPEAFLVCPMRSMRSSLITS